MILMLKFIFNEFCEASKVFFAVSFNIGECSSLGRSIGFLELYWGAYSLLCVYTNSEFWLGCLLQQSSISNLIDVPSEFYFRFWKYVFISVKVASFYFVSELNHNILALSLMHIEFHNFWKDENGVCMLKLAEESGIIIIQTPFSSFRSCGILYTSGLKPVY